MPPVLRAGSRAWVCVVCMWCLCGVCVLVGAPRCGVCRGAVVSCGASLCSSPWCPPLLRYLVVLCLLWLAAVPPSPRASLVRLLATSLSPSALRRSLLFLLLSVGLPFSLACIFPYLACDFVCVSVVFLACFLVFWVLFFLSVLIL